MSCRPSGRLLFRAALVSDTHVNEAEDFSASPYPANAEANARARFVFNQINQSESAFVIHLGDMINPVPELPTYADAANNFQAIAQSLKAPLHLMPGNHDIGDKPVSWMPAGTVNGEHIALYREHFGRDFFSFDHEGCHFVVINAPLINSGEPEETEQCNWLERDLEQHAGWRIFLFSHYPLYVGNRHEPVSYDSIDEPGRSWLVGLIERYQPEAVFAAHVHNFWYDRIGRTETYVVPSTSFVRHDYSEMYRIDGGDQKGRNDSAKLGHVTLDIFEYGHVAHYHRSYGRTARPGDCDIPPVTPRPHTKTSSLDRLYVDMRHAWAEEMVVAPSGAVDEFQRKRARNDYPVMALWEMGLRGLRVPVQDVQDPGTRHRIHIMADVGHRFQVYCYGLPDPATIEALKETRTAIEALELVLQWENLPKHRDHIAHLAEVVQLPIVLSRVNRRDSGKFSGGRFNHLISHGFALEECEELASTLQDERSFISGVQFSIPRSVSAWDAAANLADFGGLTGLIPRLYVKSTNFNPAESFDDDVANTHRFAEAAMAAIGFGVHTILDTLDDADRGYFARSGLIDRRFNPRLAGQVISGLVLATQGGKWSPMSAGGVGLRDDAGRILTIADSHNLEAGNTYVCPVSGSCFHAHQLPPGAPPIVLSITPSSNRNP